MYQKRFYRQWPESKDLISFHVQVSESDLYIRTVKDMSKPARELLIKCRRQIEAYIQDHLGFAVSLKPCPADPLAPGIIKDMIKASKKADVGPMAAVAGAVAEYVGRGLLDKGAKEVIVENGGDIFLACKKNRKIAVYSGEDLPPLLIELPARQTPCGICTSSGKLGHSISFGKADSVTIVAKSCALADAVATASCNIIQDEHNIEAALDFAMGIKGVFGVIAVAGKKIGIKGDIKLTK